MKWYIELPLIYVVVCLFLSLVMGVWLYFDARRWRSDRD